MRDLFLDLEGITLSYSENGNPDAPTLLLLHGNSENKELFVDYQQKFFADFHTFAIDSRGHGKSISKDNSLIINQMSDDIIAFCRKNNIDKTHLIGYSDGGNIALVAAKKCPTLFEKIIAISPNYLVKGFKCKELIILQLQNILCHFRQLLGAKMQKNIQYLQLMLNDIGIQPADLKEITTQFCILYAQNDVIKESHIKEIAHLLLHSQLHKISLCNHYDILYKKEAIEIMQQFLSK
ncbi:MAG: alpha/beta hydrolase [Bacteroidales bacterium]|jgi:pimeloyl-ACP methyl ester carboxylesterase|nr:alpha/beta hydrolase [Bacteroidales bacterium]